MGAKARCSQCREYFPKEDLLRTGLGGLGGICSEECLTAYVDRYRAKRDRRKVNREKKHTQNTGGRRLPGTCRDRVKRRDSETCRWCGTTDLVQIHHVRYRSEGGPDTPRNLISLCATCHERAHSNKKKYQPVLLLWLWLFYVEDNDVTVPAAFRAASMYPDWVDAARAFSDQVFEENRAAGADAEGEAVA